MKFSSKQSFDPAFVTAIEDDTIYHGKWWLPERPDDVVSGVLNIRKKGGIFLTLIGMFKADEHHGLGHSIAKHDIILGYSAFGNGKMCLAFANESSRDSPGISGSSVGAVQRFKIEYALMGHFEDSLNNLLFHEFSFTTTYLSDWINPQLVDISFKGNQSVVTTLPNVTKQYAGDGFKVEIHGRANTSLGTPYNVSEEVYILTSVDNPISWSEYVEKFLKPLVDLVQFGSTYLNSVTEMHVWPAGSDRSFRLYYTTNFESIKRASGRVSHDGLFRLFDFRDDDSFIIKWLAHYHKFPHVFNLYFDSRYLGFQFSVSKFLNIVQAMESYHALRTESDEVKKNKEEFLSYRYRVCYVLKENWSSFADWVKQQVRYFTQLRTRLSELFEEASPIVQEIVPDRDVFIGRVINTRNYYTHYDPESKHKVAKEKELVVMTEVLRQILNFNILMECGVNKQEVERLLTEDRYTTLLKNVVSDSGYWKTKVTEK